MKRAALIAWSVWLASPAPAIAHRLDEYLQATRIALTQDNLSVEIDLTPGVSVASQVVRLIDADGDGKLSFAEKHAYGTLFVRLAELKVDGAPTPLVLAGSEYPTIADMQAGVGTIRLTARAMLPAASSSPGPHEIRYANIHQPDMSVYLVNALAPPPGIRITDQQRDPWQHQLTLEYVIDSARGRAWRLSGGLGVATLMMCALGWFRRSSTALTVRRHV